MLLFGRFAMSRFALVALGFGLGLPITFADDLVGPPHPSDSFVGPPAPEPVLPKDVLPLTGLAPSKLFPDLCKYHYRVTTQSEACQKFCDQGFGFYYSYVWIEAARSFEMALRHDPECAMAWLGLHRSLEKWGRSKSPSASPLLAVVGVPVQAKLPDRFAKSPKDYALEMAKALMPKASHREQLLVTAKLQEKGMWPDVKPDERKKKATDTLNELLTLYDDDEEGWFARAQIAEGPNSSVPFYKAVLKLNPLHPGANHELVHHFENIKRPALGWIYAEKYMESSPGIPHAFHMQAHLAMRVGKWMNTTDWSSRAYRMEKEYHQFQGVKPGEDHQFNHHMESLTRALVHDGRFDEAKTVQADAKGYGYKFNPEWFRMAVTQHDWDAAEAILSPMRKSDKAGAAYYAAIVALERGDTKRAEAEMDVMRQATKKGNNYRLWEVQGRLLCQTGQGEAGVKLFKRIVEKTKDDFAHHAWGGGAYYMEQWGVAALEAGIVAEAEEAFQESLAHDAGSVRGALGLWALCERLGRTEEAARYLKVARRCWAKASATDFDRLQRDMAKRAEKMPAAAVVTSNAGAK
jgi:Tfp pilus assembly protein PilF